MEYCNKYCGVGPEPSFSLQYPGELEEGRHLITAEAVNKQCARSETAFQVFDYQAEEFSVTLIDAHEGGRFRTIGLDISVAGPMCPVTVYYLLLPPGSAAPSAGEIENYNGPGLLDGTAAKGSVNVCARGRQHLDLSGQDHAASDALGVVDGCRYDVYLFARSGGRQTSVMAKENIMGMAFGGGRGVEDDPYLICQLTASDILRYPDLSAAKCPLGVDDTARMLRNIENMHVLSLETEGRYGLRGSMSLSYQITGPIDLAGYAAADEKNGWPAIGYRGEDEEVLPFTGVLRGRGTASPIRNLTVISHHARRYIGLFAFGEAAVFQNLVLENALIHIQESPDDELTRMDIGLLCAVMRNSRVERIKLADSVITRAGIAINTITGGLVGEGEDGIIARALLAEHVHMNISEGAAGSLFGVVYSQKQKGMIAENILIRDCSVISDSFPAGLFAGRISGPEFLKDITARDCKVFGSAVMGLIGHCNTTQEHCVMENLNSERLRISGSREDSYYIGGVFGYLVAFESFLLRCCKAACCELNGNQGVGGFIGYIRAHKGLQVEHCYVTDAVLMGVEEAGGGFVGSIRLLEQTEQSRIFRDCCAELIRTVICRVFAGGFAGRCYKARNVEEKILFCNCTSRGRIHCMDHSCGGFIGFCDVGVYNQCHSECEVSAPALAGGFAGDCRALEPDEDSQAHYHIFFTRCSAVGVVRQEGAENSHGRAGGFAGRAGAAHITESYSDVLVYAEARYASAFLGLAGEDTVIRDCYATGDVEMGNGGEGGIFGSSYGGNASNPQIPEITVLRCYYQGKLTQSGAGTGGIGGQCDGEGGVTVKDSFVLSSVISGEAPTRRVIGGSRRTTVLSGNYATTLQVLEDGELKPLENNPNGQDGETIMAGQMIQWLAAAGWPGNIWDYDSVVGNLGPKLRNNP